MAGFFFNSTLVDAREILILKSSNEENLALKVALDLAINDYTSNIESTKMWDAFSGKFKGCDLQKAIA